MNYYLGVEIGGTKQQIALVSETGRLEKVISEKIPLPNGAADVLEWMKRNIPKLLSVAPVQSMGVGFGGPLDSCQGRVTTSVQVKGWNDFHLKTWFQSNFGLETVVVNDTVAGGYGELLWGSGQGKEYFYYTNIGTGIGGAMFIKGKPYDGIGFGAAYMGHTYVPHWFEPGTAVKLEEICCGIAIEKRLRSPGYVPSDSLLTALCDGNHSILTCQHLNQAACQGDRFSLEEIDRWAQSYSIGLSNFITLFSPERVSIGGGVANMGELILQPVRKYVKDLVFIASRDHYDIVTCKLLDHAVLVGAAMFARDGFHSI